ncbi:MAG: hypothetical protein ACLS36_08000 [Streptococcus sp.]
MFLWGLAVYGLVTFNYGKFGSELFMEVLSVLVDLSYHQFDLCDFLCAWSSIYRSSERFTVDEAMVIEVDDDSYQVSL